MKLSLRHIAPLAFFALAPAACSSGGAGEGTASTGEAIVDVVADGADYLTGEPDDLGEDPEPMLSDEAIDRDAARTDDVLEDEAARELDEETALVDAQVRITSAAPKPPVVHCKKRIHVTFAVYTYLSEQLGSNGCWVADRTTQDTDYRDCHSDGSVKNPHGTHWFYDDTNPYNDLGRERAAIAHCSAGAKGGFEYMAFRAGRWRLVTRPNTIAYFAELYTDDAHVDDLYYARGVYRGNATLAAHRRAAPMLNFAPYPDTISQARIGREVLKVCKTIRNHGYLGLYEWHYPLPHDSPRLHNLANALNACTKKR